MFIQIDRKTVDLIESKGATGFQLSCVGRIDNGKLNIVAHIHGCDFEDLTNVEIVMSTENY